ncbi:MAG: TRAP-type transport system periplasmic protein [Clostridiales bacterium]|nr:TRAP-type transport system periplasmic protein [Clostridiales bacterium]MDK2934944.1 TRAP-type transport system periplasmic protein [Clostridiales bacterium]
MKKFFSMFLVVILIATTLVGCGQKPGASNDANKKETKTEAKPEVKKESKSKEKPIEITFAIHTQPNTNEVKSAEMFKKLVEERSNGQITVKLFPGAVLGGEKDNMEQLKVGEIQMSIFGDILTSQLAPEYDPTVIPFIYPSLDEVYKTWNGPLGDKIKNALIERGGVQLIALQKRGARNLTANKKIETPEDLKGLKLRVPEIPTWVTVWKGLGALPTPIAWSEVYSALQTNVVDAQENPYENILTAKLNEVQKYTMKTEHLYNVFHWVVGKKFFDGLTPEHQKIILTAAEEATKWGDEQKEKLDKELEQKLIDLGNEIVTVDKKLFRQAALPAIKELSKDWAPGVWDEVKGYLE